MAEHSSERITLDELCSVATMSRRMFTENFKAATGVTSKRYLLALRLNKAQLMLSLTTLPTREIAQRCGFAEKSRLAHVFAENLGMTPTEYRRKTRDAALREARVLEKRYSWLYGDVPHEAPEEE